MFFFLVFVSLVYVRSSFFITAINFLRHTHPHIGHTLKQLRIERNSNLLREHNTETMAKGEEQSIILRYHYLLTTYTPPSCLHRLDITAAHYEIKSSIIQMLPSFCGVNNENLYKLLDEFLKICSTIKLQGFTKDA